MPGVVWVVKTFRVYVHGVHFAIVTDHLPLLWPMTKRELAG